MTVLDAYTGNYTAHHFYFNQRFCSKGFTLKILSRDGLS
jgi:hypothetical protein